MSRSDRNGTNMNDAKIQTKVQIANRINEIRTRLGMPLVSSWKVKDLSKESLLELLEIAEDTYLATLQDYDTSEPMTSAVEQAACEAAEIALESGVSQDEIEQAAADAATEVLEAMPVMTITVPGVSIELVDGKVCKGCGEFFTYDNYGRDKKRKDGYFHLHGTRKEGCVRAYYDDLKTRKALETN